MVTRGERVDVLIVGAGHGGAAAAIALRQLGYAGSITIAGAEPELPYERPPLSKEYFAGEKTFDFTRGYYEPRVGVLTLGGKAVTSVDDLKGKSIACTTGTVQNKFIEAVLPDGDIHTYDGGTQCLQEVLAGRIDAYLCDGAEGQSMRDANKGLVLGLLDRKDTQDYVGVYRVMATKGATFVKAFDQEIGKMLKDGTLDKYIKRYVGADFAWGDDVSAAGTATEGVK